MSQRERLDLLEQVEPFYPEGHSCLGQQAFSLPAHDPITADEAAAALPPHLAAKARNPLQVELATILTTEEKEPKK